MKEEISRRESLFIGPVLRGWFTAAVAGMVTLLVFVAILSIFGVRPSGLQITMVFLAYAMVLLGGIASGRRSSSRGWLAGGVSGTLFFVTLLVINALFVHSPVGAFMALLRVVIASAVGAAGGMIGVNLRASV